MKSEFPVAEGLLPRPTRLETGGSAVRVAVYFGAPLSELTRTAQSYLDSKTPNVGAKRAATAQPLSVRLSDQFGHTEKD